MPERADYGKQTLKELSKALTNEFGKGFSRANLYNMRQFYLSYEKVQSVTGKLTWKSEKKRGPVTAAASVKLEGAG